jgi:hypothetical protein
MRARRLWNAVTLGLLCLHVPVRADPPARRPALPRDVLRDWEAARRDARTQRPPPPPPGPMVFPLERTRLANGLEVVLAPWPLDPRVRVAVEYRVGDGDGPDGHRETAHAVEHLLFREAPGVPAIGPSIAAFMAGGAGGTTYSDRTVYESEVEPEHLERLLWLEGARMRAAERFIHDAAIARERPILQHEEALVTTRWTRLRSLALRAAFPAAHRSHGAWSPPTAIDALRVEHLRDLVRDRYAPGNARLVVTGGFDPARVRPWIERDFADIPARPVPPRPRDDGLLELARTREVRVRSAFPETVVLVWPGPEVDACHDVDLVLLAAALRRAVAARPDFGQPERAEAHWRVETLHLGRQVFLVFEANADLGGGDRAATLRAMDTALTAAREAFEALAPVDRSLFDTIGDALVDEARQLGARTERIVVTPSPDDPGGYRCAHRAVRLAEPATVRDLARRWLTARRLVLQFQRDAALVGLRVDAVEPP